MFRRRSTAPAPSGLEAIQARARTIGEHIQSRRIAPEVTGLYPDRPTTGVVAAIKNWLGVRPKPKESRPHDGVIIMALPPFALLDDGRFVSFTCNAEALAQRAETDPPIPVTYGPEREVTAKFDPAAYHLQLGLRAARAILWNLEDRHQLPR
jgi:hypothetical protein